MNTPHSGMYHTTKDGDSPEVVKRRIINDEGDGGFRSSGFRKLRSESWGSVQRWEKENELIFAMIEDECEWLSTLFPDEVIAPEYFFIALQDGVLLCKLVQLIQNHAAEFGRKHAQLIPDFIVRYHPRTAKKGRAAQFKARENVTLFLNWCRAHKIPEVILFESNDAVETEDYREGAREIVICLMEVARKAWKYGVHAPKLVLLEKEIEEEEKEDGSHSPSSVDSGVDFDDLPATESKTDVPASDATDSGKQPNGNNSRTQRNGPPKSELDRKVLSLIEEYSIGKITRLKEGKYIILGRVMFIRMLNDHVLVRIGGGWDTLEHYLMTHAKPSAVERVIRRKPEEKKGLGRGQTDRTAVATNGSDKPSSSSRPNTPMTNKLGGASARSGTPASGQLIEKQKFLNPTFEEQLQDAREISDAIRKIESSVTKSISKRPRTPSQQHELRAVDEASSPYLRKISDSHLTVSNHSELQEKSGRPRSLSMECLPSPQSRTRLENGGKQGINEAHVDGTSVANGHGPHVANSTATTAAVAPQVNVVRKQISHRENKEASMGTSNSVSCNTKGSQTKTGKQEHPRPSSRTVICPAATTSKGILSIACTSAVKVTPIVTTPCKKTVLFRSASDTDRLKNQSACTANGYQEKKRLRRSLSEPGVVECAAVSKKTLHIKAIDDSKKKKATASSKQEKAPLRSGNVTTRREKPSTQQNLNGVGRQLSPISKASHLAKSTPSLVVTSSKGGGRKKLAPSSSGGSTSSSGSDASGKRQINKPGTAQHLQPSWSSSKPTKKPGTGLNKRLSKSSGNLLSGTTSSLHRPANQDVFSRLYKPRNGSSSTQPKGMTSAKSMSNLPGWKHVTTSPNKNDDRESALARRLAYSSKLKPKKSAEAKLV